MFITNMLSVAKLQKNEENAKGKGLFLFISECQQLQKSQNFKNIFETHSLFAKKRMLIVSDKDIRKKQKTFPAYRKERILHH